MLESDPPQMNPHPYSEINPYYLIYCNMNIRITEDVTRQAAENVVRQIGYLHNAMGCVFKDLIKIVAYRFPEQKGPQNGQQMPKERVPPMGNQMGTSNRQPMDIESDHSQQLPRQSKPNKPRQQQSRIPNQPLLRGQPSEQPRREQPIKPASVDIFDEFAYSKEQPENTKNKEIIKMGLAKVIEGVQRKRKESKVDDKEERREKEEKELWPQEGPKKSERSLREQREIREQREREKRPQPSGNSMRQLLNKSMQPSRQEQPDIFNEFVYESKPQDPPLPPPSSIPQSLPSPSHNDRSESRQQQSKLWQFLRQKQTPAIYEISDDEDNH